MSRPLSSLQTARELEAPIPLSSKNGEMEGAEFWKNHSSLLNDAWKEWETSQNLPVLTLSELLDPLLRDLVKAAWKNPQNEVQIKELWSEIAPNVYGCQFFDPEKIGLIREHIDKASFESKIPTRRPNGMNRYGLLLNSDIDGAVNLSEFQKFYNELVDFYVRPLGRLLFPEYVGEGDDHESYAFTIRYKAGEDVSLNEHADASVITMNVNLNSPDQNFDGSTLYFLDDDGVKHNVTFKPGMALFHRGQTRHASLPIEFGERTNMVIWLHGQYGYVRIAPYEENERLSPRDRWKRIYFAGSRFSGSEL